MHNQPWQDSKVYPLNVDASGRLVLPAETRLRQAAKNGESLVAAEDAEGRLTIKTNGQLLKEIQDYCKAVMPPGESLVDELIAERKREAEHE